MISVVESASIREAEESLTLLGNNLTIIAASLGQFSIGILSSDRRAFDNESHRKQMPVHRYDSRRWAVNSVAFTDSSDYIACGERGVQCVCR